MNSVWDPLVRTLRFIPRRIRGIRTVFQAVAVEEEPQLWLRVKQHMQLAQIPVEA